MGARLSAETIATLTPLLGELRKVAHLREIKPGIFYAGRIPMLHFHETVDGIAADLKNMLVKPAEFDRFVLTSRQAHKALIAETTRRVAAMKKNP